MRLEQIAGNQLLQTLERLRPAFAAAAQSVYDTWELDEEGLDPELGAGGICDSIADAIGHVLVQNGVDYTDGGHDGDDHAYLVAYNSDESYVVDIPCHIYEQGGGYSWTKVPDVQFEPSDVTIVRVDRPDWIDG